MCKTIKQKVKFSAPPETVYRLLANSKDFQFVTGKKTKIGKKIGDRFSLYAGDISGIQVDLKPGKRIVQAWQTTRFPEGVFSMAALVLQPSKNGGTDLTLTHRGVPKELIPEIEVTWRTLYWNKLKKFMAT